MDLIKKILKKVQHIYYGIPILLSKKKNVKCPFCNWEGKEFFPFGIKIRKNAKCPRCGSLERHRLCYLYLKKVIPKNKKMKVLHFAPEKILTNLFKSYENIEYLSADINSRKAMVKEDITNLSFKDDSFDIIFCSHVLEHIEDDIKAMKEIKRVLKQNGFAILQVPIYKEFNGKKIKKTFEDFSIKSPKEREKVFGQYDHVRIYGKDYKDRLEKAGFKVNVDRFIDSLGKEDVKRFGLIREENEFSDADNWIWFCEK